MIDESQSYFNKPIDSQEFIQRITKLLDKINTFKSSTECYKFFIEEYHVGFIDYKVANELRKYPNIFIFDDKNEYSRIDLETFEDRTKAIEEVLNDLKEKNLFKTLNGWRNEHYFVRKSFNSKALMSIERAGACLFGTRSYGCHINGYIKKNNEYFMWIARRSKTKQTYPFMLDNFVAGGLTAGLSVFECAKKELEEEAGLTIELSSRLKSTDAISYSYQNGSEIHIEGEFIFDIKLPSDFVPKNQDGEVFCFYLMNIHQVKNAIISDEFKPNSAVVTLNFLMRKDLLTPDELPNYFEILENIHKPGL
ncbi:unnamed protein product [Brachionus calyciflorus]|uniref:Nudix hydrolase domain-containing protein n=1 Tax=Brachionus calyciflorus TaxID=104777 RepID=A0A813NIK9_9BILA|nr:unnamed protein product [Brachionus calyciflorus]